MSIKLLNEQERPREKLLHKGASSLTDAELLALLISSGTKEKSAIDLARDILQMAHNNLQELGKLSLTELQKTKGIGEARAITIAAAMELGRRRQFSEALDRPQILHGYQAIHFVRPLLQDLAHEVFCVLYLNTSFKLIKYEISTSGGVDQTIVDPRVIFKNALLYNASRLIVAHNHPSGEVKPSDQDKYLTLKLSEAARLVGMELADHIIISGNKAHSMKDAGDF
jgi:DNA repair protein RadC